MAHFRFKSTPKKPNGYRHVSVRNPLIGEVQRILNGFLSNPLESGKAPERVPYSIRRFYNLSEDFINDLILEVIGDMLIDGCERTPEEFRVRLNRRMQQERRYGLRFVALEEGDIPYDEVMYSFIDAVTGDENELQWKQVYAKELGHDMAHKKAICKPIEKDEENLNELERRLRRLQKKSSS